MNKDKILIIEDSRTHIKYLENCLQDYELIICQTGEEGLNAALTYNPDLILLDLTLPDIDGLELCRRLKSGKVLSGTPIIVLTTRDEVEKAFSLGSDDYLRKPFLKEELLARIETRLEMSKMQKRIRISETRYRTLVERVYDGILIIDNEGKVIFANQQASKLLNIPIGDMIGSDCLEYSLSFFDLSNNDDPMQEELIFAKGDKIKEFIESLEDRSFRCKVNYDDGHIKFLKGSLISIEELNKAEEYLLVFRDITEEVLEKRLQQAYSFLSKITNLSYSLERVAERFTIKLKELLEVRGVTIYFRDYNGDLALVGESGIENEVVSGIKLKENNCLYNIAKECDIEQKIIFKNLQSYCEECTRCDEAYDSPFYEVIGIPLIHNAELLGILQMIIHDGNNWFELESELLSSFIIDITNLFNTKRLQLKLEDKHQRLLNNISKARMIQEALFPQRLPQLPALDIAARHSFAEHLGGDFYDIFVIDEEYLGFYLADVSGHGIDAALMTIFIKSNIVPKEGLNGENRIRSPKEVIKDLERKYQQENFPADKFIAIFYGLLNYKTGELTYSATGFVNFPIKFNQEDTEELVCSGPVINSYIQDFEPVEKKLRLKPGDSLFLYTDGLVEETDNKGEMYGEERLIESIKSCCELDTSHIMEKIKYDFESFVRKNDYTDDITYLLLRKE
ncbi:PAS domain S-box-containing protein [Candidatus Frackibacter sp. WG12]|uniref:SpoIIE family protein phosphatase n=1 Tax=unclassified Candidatus Frackibacter TaxID=2648818 RepID=UPI00088ADB74|nr:MULTISPECIES: SpoIIE family protein phosphatase [unclassified Candidatus Frackibacter]SDC87368.1 PAS domain S-box-containing protein [Candidatus Frackibacter sp. WG11]SEN01318.1 PAS domain S-box-containing protein [Candidatus Frackibacter sp. WG12]